MGGISRCRKPVGPHTDNADCSDIVIALLWRSWVIAADLRRRAVGGFDGVPTARLRQLVQGCLDEIDAQDVSQAYEIDSHIAQLRP
jgi:hypothetical protein